MSELISGLQSALKSVGKQWKKEKLHQNRVNRTTLDYLRSTAQRQTVKEASFQVMEDAIYKASGNGRYLANARQIMYAARSEVLKITGGKIWSNSAYFTQNILKDYIEQNEGNPIIESIVWDARGHITEPFTKRIIPLGGAAVSTYIKEWTSEFDIFGLPEPQKRIDTIGSKHRFSNVLFIEKEGFDAILKAAGIAEKYDIAIMSTKGVPVEAACQLTNQFSSNRVRIFVLHDFDFAGFKIIQTLKQGTRLSPRTPVIDLGFRMSDIQNLQSEAVNYQQEIDPRYYLKNCGVTEEECNFLVSGNSYYKGCWSGQRVELNAMTSDQFILWLEEKLKEHSVQKVIPDEKMLARTYQKAVLLLSIEKEVQQIKEKFMEQIIALPENLFDRVTEILEKNPMCSWDEAVYQLAEEMEEDKL